jgi:CubicO group peptidase (beta-lactamase class C family)
VKTEKLDAILDELIEKRQIRHAVIGVETGDGSSRWIGAAGVADPDGTPMHGDTPYFTASVTKLFVAAAVLKLHEQGKVHLDDAIDSLFPEPIVRGLHMLRGVDYTKRITVAHLLIHTSGVHIVAVRARWASRYVSPGTQASALEGVRDLLGRRYAVSKAVAYRVIPRHLQHCR